MLRCQRLLLMLAVIAIPFILSLAGLPFLGGMGKNLSYYPLIILALSFLLNILVAKARPEFPRATSFYMLLLFFLWLAIDGALNLPELMTVSHQGVSGSSRYVSQMLAFVSYVFIAWGAYKVIKQAPKPLDVLQKGLYISFAIAGFYSLFEIASFFTMADAMEIVTDLDSLFRSADEKPYFLHGRIRSVTAEASCFGMYAGLLLPWMLAGFFQYPRHRRIFIVALAYLFLLILLTSSRTAYVITAIELLLVVAIFWRDIKRAAMPIMVAIVVAIASMGLFAAELEETLPISIDVTAIFNSLVEDDGVHDMSNLARIGSQRAAYSMFLDNPVIGVGFGGYGFYAADYVSPEVWRSGEIMNWLGAYRGDNLSWPPVHGLYARLLAETGAIGMVLWCMVLFCLFRELRQLEKRADSSSALQLKAMQVSMIGSVLNGFNLDGFTSMALWILIAFIWGTYARQCLDSQ